MSEIESETPEEVDPIEVTYTVEFLSLSGRSTLQAVIGRNSDDQSLHIAISGNSGGGMWCRDWASAKAIQDVVLGEEALTAASLNSLHPGRSINTGGFILAALKELGLIIAKAENSRLHEHVPGATFDKAVMAYFSAHGAATPKKSKKLKAAD